MYIPLILSTDPTLQCYLCKARTFHTVESSCGKFQQSVSLTERNGLDFRDRPLDLQGGYGFSFSANFFFFQVYQQSIFFLWKAEQDFFPSGIKTNNFSPLTLNFPHVLYFATELSNLFLKEFF